jgi:methylase of polypeptide subunit release factors
MTVREAIARVGARLQAAGLSEPLREAQALIAACLGWERARLIAHPDARLSARQVQRLECWARRRAAREPLAYLTRRAWFYGLALTVGRGALIPRPETELLVEVFLGWARGGNALTPSPSPTGWARGGNALTPSPSPTGWARGGNALTPSPSPTGWERGAEFSLSRLAGEGDQGGEGSNFPILVDAGTGTGAVALACLTHAPHWLGVGIDRSRRALRLAQANRRTLGLQSRLMLVQGDWLRGLGRGVVDAVLSNPPYVLPDEWDALQPEITRYEPTGALLVPADDPLRRYRRIAQGAHRSLRLGGLLAFETSPRLAPLLAEQLPVWGFPSPHIVCDYAGDARVVWAVRG